MNPDSIIPIIKSRGDRRLARECLADAPFFDSGIMKFHDEALKIWRSVAHRYSNKEQDLSIPFSLAERPKLYALDALCIATPLVQDQKQLKPIAELFNVFYLMTHFFDDHVEHPDKFFSKFDFIPNASISTQHGAAPFSFILLSFSIISDILNEASSLSPSSKLKIQTAMYDRLAVQTRHFTSERDTNLKVEEVLEMKARRVNGQTLGVLADILTEFLNYDEKTRHDFEQGLLYLGSIEQITDDIRDIAIDGALRNANIVISSQSFGSEAGAKVVARIYDQEQKSAKKFLTKFYRADELYSVLSLPFYPFMVDKQQLESEA